MANRVLLEVEPFTSVSQLCEDLVDPDVAVTIGVVTDDDLRLLLDDLAKRDAEERQIPGPI